MRLVQPKRLFSKARSVISQNRTETFKHLLQSSAPADTRYIVLMFASDVHKSRMYITMFSVW
jgi:hypothetical protein